LRLFQALEALPDMEGLVSEKKYHMVLFILLLTHLQGACTALAKCESIC
jgi:hypothetical protein